MPSRTPSMSTLDARQTLSRQTHAETEGDVFSDSAAFDYSTESRSHLLENTPGPSHPYSDHNSHTFHFTDNVEPEFDDVNIDPFSDRAETTSLSENLALLYPPPPNRQSDGASIRKGTPGATDELSQHPDRPHRTMSTSSRFSFNRSPSPYNGPTAPSQPYAMYPQITRASSTTSRPGAETPFIHTGGPSQPYSMFAQNTVPEEGEDITTAGIPLTFGRSGQPSSEAGDIMHADGHIEQLPPYSRYADNTLAKGNMDRFNSLRLSRRSTRASLRIPRGANPAPVEDSAMTEPLSTLSTLEQQRTTHEESAPLNPFNDAASSSGLSEKSWKDKMHRKSWFGLPLWVAILMPIAFFFSCMVTGITSGLIFWQRGREAAYAHGALATTTLWLDASPTSLAPGMTLPTGIFQLPLNQTAEIKNCITQYDQLPAWGCMDIAYVGINITKPRPDGPPQVVFDDISSNTANFRYGPQPADFNGTAFSLEPVADKDNDWGVAMFFSALFDKLSIIPEHVLTAPSVGARSYSEADILRRAAPYDGKPLKAGEKPWYCIWNGTVSEFFIYMQKDAPAAPSSYSSEPLVPGVTTPESAAPTISPLSVSTTTVNRQALSQTTAWSGWGPTPTTSSTIFPAYNPVRPTEHAQPVYKRSYYSSSAGSTNYPQFVRVVEKRKPLNPIQPYCQMMQVLDNFDIVPLVQVPRILINEVEWTPASAATSTWNTNNKRDLEDEHPQRQLDRRQESLITELESNCICDWQSY